MSLDIIDEPFIIVRKANLEFVWTDNFASPNFYVPIPPKGYRNLGHYVEFNEQFPDAPYKYSDSQTFGDSFIFVRDISGISAKCTSYISHFQDTGSGANCDRDTDTGDCNVTILRPIPPSTDYVVMGHSFIPYHLAAPKTQDERFFIWAVKKEFVRELVRTSAIHRQRLGNDTIGGTGAGSIFTTVFHMFLCNKANTNVLLDTDLTVYTKFSDADSISCCRNINNPITNVPATSSHCGVFYGPTHNGSCDNPLIDYCFNNFGNDPKCGCLLPSDQYAQTKLVGPIECVDRRCTTVVDAYKAISQRDVVCPVANCVIDSVVINAQDSQIDNIKFQQDCGVVVGCDTPGGCVSSKLGPRGPGATGNPPPPEKNIFTSTLTSPLGILTIILIVLAIIFIIAAVSSSSRRRRRSRT